MTPSRRVFVIALLSTLAPSAFLAQEADPLLQVDARVSVNGHRPRFFEMRIEPGVATARGRVQTQPGGETAQVTLRFDYRIKADIALDEIISLIVISIEDSVGNQFSTVTIDPNTIHLNPNRVPLDYSVTLYIPNDTHRSDYVAHIQVFGNYE